MLDLAQIDSTTEFLGDLGLGMLFFFAGYEIDFARIKGKPLTLGMIGWALSLAIAYGLGGALAAAGVFVSYLYTGSAMATTAIGTLIPILRDAGELRTRFGTYLLAARGDGRVRADPARHADPLHHQPAARGADPDRVRGVAVFTGVIAVRSSFKGWAPLERTLETSSQLAVRLAVVLVFGLVALAAELGLDILLGGFVAGMITRMALRGREVGVLESKLTAVGYGLLIPFFFITSGMEFDVDALGSAEALAKMALFVALFLIVRGTPGAAALPQGDPGDARPGRARVLRLHSAAAGGRDHIDRGRGGPHALLDRRRPGRRGDHLDARLPADRDKDQAGRPEGEPEPATA